MNKRDARTLSNDVRQNIRDQIIRLRKQGKKNKDIALFLGVSAQHASTLWQRYRQGGKSAIALGTRGRRHGEKRTLSVSDEGFAIISDGGRTSPIVPGFMSLFSVVLAFQGSGCPSWLGLRSTSISWARVRPELPPGSGPATNGRPQQTLSLFSCRNSPIEAR